MMSRVFLAVLLVAAPLSAAPRPRIVRPPAIYVGEVQVIPAFVLTDPEVLAEVRLQEQELRAHGLRLEGNRLLGEAAAPAGFRVRIGDQDSPVRHDGSFMVLPVPESVVTGEVSGKDGALRTTFNVREHLVPIGGTPKPIVMTLELSDRPNLMNEWDTESGQADAHSGGGHEHDGGHPATLLCPAPSTACTRDTNCPNRPTSCCLDYNGLCADGSRYAGGTGCKLRFLQFTGST
jgi:hypothetical protein